MKQRDTLQQTDILMNVKRGEMRWFGLEDINLNEADNSVKLRGWPQEEGGRGWGGGSFSVCVSAPQHVCPLASASLVESLDLQPRVGLFVLHVRKIDVSPTARVAHCYSPSAPVQPSRLSFLSM